MQTRSLLAAAALAALSMSVSAQSLKPGLWEVTNKTSGNPQMEQAMAEMQKQMASMPPAQRKQMEAMMGQNGMSVGAGGAVTVKVCITPEMAARSELPSQTEGDCTSTITSRTGNTLKSKFACKNPPTTGEGTYTFSGDKAFATKMVMQTVRNGKPETMTMEGQGKWLSADCGNIKPIQPPKQ